MKKTLYLALLLAVFTGCKKADNTLPELPAPNPPVVSTTPSVAAIAPASAKPGEVITITGTNFSTVLSENEVVFSSSAATGAVNTNASTVSVTVKTATATTLTVEVPGTAISGTITVKVKGVTATLSGGFTAAFTVIPPTVVTNPTSATLATYNTEYYLPDHIATDAAGNVYTSGLVTGKQLIKINPQGQRIKVYGPTDFGLVATEQPYIVGVCNDKDGTVWVLMVIANKPCRLYKITANTDPALDRTIDNTQSSLGTTSIPDMAMASNGDLYYVVEAQNYRVKKIDKAGVETYFITAVNNNNPFGYTGSNLTVTDLSFDSQDVLYMSVVNAQGLDFFGLYSYTLAGVQTKLYSSTARGPELPTEGSLSATNFRTLTSLVVSGDGKNLFIGDGYYIRKITLTDTKVTTVAGSGKQSNITYTYSGEALKGNITPAKLTFSPDQKSIIVNSYGVLEKFTL